MAVALIAIPWYGFHGLCSSVRHHVPLPSDSVSIAMGRLARGDRSAFDDVFARVWPTVRQVCARALGDGPDADDAAQQALEKVFFQAADYDLSRPALPWVLAIASWECATVLKTRARRSTLPLSEEANRPTGSTPELLLSAAQLTDALEQALGRLSDRDREVLTSAYRDELSRVQPVPALMRKRKERALQRLRTLWRTLHGE